MAKIMKKTLFQAQNYLGQALRWLLKPSSWVHIFRINCALALGTGNLLLNGLGFPLVAVYLLTHPEATKLPTWLSWYDNADNDGIWGDAANQERNARYGWNPCGFLAKFHWIMIRNSLNNFKYRVLGFYQSDIASYSQVIEQAYVKDQYVGDYSSGGLRYIEVNLKNGQKRWEYYAVLPYTIGSKSLCFRARLGWVINNPHEPDEFQSKRTYFRFTCSINPFKTYRGKTANRLLPADNNRFNANDCQIPEQPSKTFTPALNLNNKPLLVRKQADLKDLEEDDRPYEKTKILSRL